MTDTAYDPKLGRNVHPGAQGPCPHGWNESCPHCMRGEIESLRAQLASANELAESLQRRLDLEFDSYAKEGWEAKIAKAKRALRWIVNSPSAHPANMVKVAEEALKDLP